MIVRYRGFLVPMVLRGTPYLGCRVTIGMHFHAGAMGTMNETLRLRARNNYSTTKLSTF